MMQENKLLQQPPEQSVSIYREIQNDLNSPTKLFVSFSLAAQHGGKSQMFMHLQNKQMKFYAQQVKLMNLRFSESRCNGKHIKLKSYTYQMINLIVLKLQQSQITNGER